MIGNDKQVGHQGSRSFHSLMLPLLLVMICHLSSPISAFLCDPLQENTWLALTSAIQTSPGFLLLCPFEIEGEGCPNTGLGYIIPENDSLTMICEKDVFGASTPTTAPACVIDCPGNHFTIARNASLTLDGFTLRGSQTSAAIYMQPTGQLQVYDSSFYNNYNPSGSGGAIYAGESAQLVVNQCQMQNNTALTGGAIYAEGNSQITDSEFVNNLSTSTKPKTGGGAVTLGALAETVIADSYFEGNEAKNTIGAAILDHSDNNTLAKNNTGCNNIDAGITSESQSATSLLCNGIESSRPNLEASCREFFTSCVDASRTTSTFTHISPATSVPPTEPIPAPTNGISTTQPPSHDTDPCLSDPDSFNCALLELLDEETP